MLVTRQFWFYFDFHCLEKKYYGGQLEQNG